MRTEDESHTGQGDVQISISSKWNRVLKGKGMCQKARLQMEVSGGIWVWRQGRAEGDGNIGATERENGLWFSAWVTMGGSPFPQVEEQRWEGRLPALVFCLYSIYQSTGIFSRTSKKSGMTWTTYSQIPFISGNSGDCAWQDEGEAARFESCRIWEHLRAVVVGQTNMAGLMLRRWDRCQAALQKVLKREITRMLLRLETRW